MEKAKDILKDLVGVIVKKIVWWSQKDDLFWVGSPEADLEL